MKVEPIEVFVGRILVSVAQDRLAVEDAVREFERRESEFGTDQLLDQAWHLVRHYRADADIRARSPKYASAKRAEMEKLAEKLLKRRDDG